MVAELTPMCRRIPAGAIDAVLHYSAVPRLHLWPPPWPDWRFIDSNPTFMLVRQVAAPLAAAGTKAIEVAMRPTSRLCSPLSVGLISPTLPQAGEEWVGCIAAPQQTEPAREEFGDPMADPTQDAHKVSPDGRPRRQPPKSMSRR